MRKKDFGNKEEEKFYSSIKSGNPKRKTSAQLKIYKCNW